MTQTRKGALKAAATMKARYGDQVYETIGRMGGKVSKGGGFTNKELARRAGAIGGRNSRRGSRGGN